MLVLTLDPGSGGVRGHDGGLLSTRGFALSSGSPYDPRTVAMKLCPKCQKQFSGDANFCPVDAARLIPLEGDKAVAADAFAARFDLGPKLGGGRTGTVYRATDKQQGNKAVAVKLVAPAVLTLPGVAQRIERELKQLER